jgi:hypothetical protein
MTPEQPKEQPHEQRHQPDDDPDVRSVPLEDEDGNTVVIEQQNVGPGNQVGQGEHPDPDTPPKDPGDAADEAASLDGTTR